jgi:hypothetical protein
MESFEEIQLIGSQKIKFQKQIQILPDRNFIYDLVYDYENFAVEISEEEYLKILI